MTTLVSEGVIQNNDYFDYQYSPISEIYELVYTYCQEYLDMKSIELNIKPAKFYYSNYISINASAYKKSGYYVVSVNSGTILLMRSFFLEKKSIFEKNEFKQFGNIILTLGYQVEDFLTVLFYKFIFHHEVAHLIQKNETETFSFPEEFTSTNNRRFDPFSFHVLEFDADWLASCNISFLILDLIKETGSDNLNKNNLENTVTLAIAGIISYFLKSNTNKELYFEKEKHPHNFIRLIYITEFILPAIIHNTKIQLDTNNILTNVLKLTTIFFENEEQNPIRDFAATYLNEKVRIREYIEKLKKAVSNNDMLSMKKLKSVDMFGKTLAN
jgi:hypothetical protein